MFGIFKKKTHKPSVIAEDKEWVEKNIIWFIEVFGLDKLRKEAFILPTFENFPYTNLTDTKQFKKLFERLCRYWDLNPNEIIVKFFDDIKSKQWTTWIPEGEFEEPGGLFNQIYNSENKRFKIQLAKSNLNNPQRLVSVIAHELAHVKLIGGNYINRKDADIEPLTDLASIFFGFGIFVANGVQSNDIYWISRSGYLPNQLISYANALICYITEQNAKSYFDFLNSNTKELFKNDFEFLSFTNDTLLIKNKISEYEITFKIGKQIIEGFEKKSFDKVIIGSKELLKLNQKNIAAYNNIGYALLQQKKYQEAIEQFTKAIDIDPYWDYPYNNRGYCKLQLGDLENAFSDIQSSFEMNSDNSYSWRNLGAYYLAINEYDKALIHFIKAEKIDPKTEMINFYLGLTHRKLESSELADKYLSKSKQLKEYNDSTTE